VESAARDFEGAAEFRTALRHFLRRAEDVARANDLTLRRYELLLQLKAAPGERLTLIELCELLQLGQPAASELVQRAEESGLVHRTRLDGDRRHVYIRLAIAGEKRLRAAFEGLAGERELLAEVFVGRCFTPRGTHL
jgi:DNA-binding MarR family transcriptional regulator